MSEHSDHLESRLKKLEEDITETQKRLPAHSIKPPVMMDLLELEDERDALLEEIARLKGSE
ncbi:MAG: histidine kinase [Deltaproteobacteria bacterium]|nr:histidine kinase [Deltaproteobacteria bacterium]